MIQFKSNYSQTVLLRLLVMMAVLLAGVAAAYPFIVEFYFRNQRTMVGLAINGAIVGLFLVGLARLVYLMLRYVREEAALGKFVRGLDGDFYHPVDSINPRTLILQRYKALLTLNKQHAPINHAALASTLLANESSRLSLPKFINNILILMGVFGTIVSLSIALVGASHLLDNVDATGEMGLVIHGMSTALSTTMTAIVCYLFYGYAYLKLQDAKTHLLSGIEQVTTLYLLPRFTHTGDSVLHEVAEVVRNLRETAEQMHTTQVEHAEAARKLGELIALVHQRIDPIGEEMRAVRSLLREGFRLPAGGE